MAGAERIAFISQKRTTLKSQLTNTLTALAQNKINKSNADLRLTRLTELFHNYEELHDELALLDSENEGLNDLTDIQDKFYEIAARIKSMPGQSQLSDESLSNRPMGNSTFLEKQRQLKLPIAELPKFNGDIEKWLSFKNTFLTMIDSRTDIDNLVKFLYLRSALEGEALNKLAIYDASAENYKNGWKLLIDSYEKKRILASKHIDAILDITPLTKATSSGLSKLISVVRQHLNMLQSLRVVPNATVIIRILERALPIDIRQKWEESLGLDTLPDLPQLYKFINETAFRLCSLEQDNKTGKIDVDKRRRSEHENKATKIRKNESGLRSFVSSASNACVKCRENHPLYKCLAFGQSTVNQRWDFVKTNKLCRNCLRAHEGACNSSRCKRCNKFHHTLLHSGDTKPNAPKFTGNTKGEQVESKTQP